MIFAAAVLRGVGEPLKVEEIQVDPPKASEVRIKMLCASLCHTDVLCCNGLPIVSTLFCLFFSSSLLLHIYVNRLQLPALIRDTLDSLILVFLSGFSALIFVFLSCFSALVPPNSWSRRMVESVGEGVTEVKEGDIVMPTYIGECGKCDNCRSGKSNLCHTYPLPFNGVMPDGTSRMSTSDGTRIYHHFTCSTWSEYIVIGANYVVKVDPRIPLPHASFMSCGYSTGFGSTWREVLVHKGSTVAVLGLGAVGLGVIEGARTQEAARIIGVDINEKKRALGEVFGMTDFINPSKDSDKRVSEFVNELTGGLGVDYCFECTGVPSLLNEAIESSKVGIGSAVLIGAGTETSGQINFIPLLCGRTLKGSIYGGIRTKSDLPIIFDKCLNKELHLEELLTHEVSLDEINKALKVMKQPDCVKVIIKY
ncbi:hypothetical protein RHMOL_Rhmol03G0247100 [Rhododendron molle]|uniref:Uncharacterized protein n=1 Tax=Rhododendron molle TaxID=49168 RepID=A0ACC0PI75_RHOML|nr:hypothetical protein RHMOL_Rhmol03G0247100 [Rhododendron molle]